MGPVCTIMVGRLDDWMKVLVEKKTSRSIPGNWSGPGSRCSRRLIGCIASAAIARVCSRLLFAITCTGANSLEEMWLFPLLIPGRCDFNASDVEVRSRIDDPVSEEIEAELSRNSKTSAAPALSKDYRLKNLILWTNPPHASPVYFRLSRVKWRSPRCLDSGSGYGLAVQKAS